MHLAAASEEAIRQKVRDAFSVMMGKLHQQKGAVLDIQIMADPAVTEFIDTHAAVLDSAVQQQPMSDTMRRRLQRSNYIFSGMKTFHELNEAFPSLLDENGNRKPFERFLNDVQKIDDTYNTGYLRAEYNFVQASAEMAAKWESFMEDGDRYYLQYRTQNDDHVRPEHAALHGVTLPPSDSFWQEYYPPNGWNCRCTVVQVRKSKYNATPHDEAIARGEEALQQDTKHMFRFNPGIQQKTMPDYNPYTIKRCNDCDIASKLAGGIIDNELCAACQLVRKCYEQRDESYRHGKGIVRISRLVNHDDCDFDKLKQAAEFFAKDGAESLMTPKMSRPAKFKYECVYSSLVGTKYEGKCPDLCIDGRWYEHEGFVSSNPKNAFRNMMRDGLQQADRIIIDRPNLTDRYMRRSIIGRVERGEDIKEVWIREADGKLTLLYKKTDG